METPTQPPAIRPPGLLGRAGALVLALGLLTACGGDTTSPAADGDAYAPPASAPATTGETATGETATEESTTEESATEESTTEESTQGTSGTDDDAADELVIVIEDFDYELPDTVPPGARLTVRNQDGVGHTVTADDGSAFDVAVGPGEEVTFRAPDEAGEHPFHCIPHPGMTGTLVVEER